MTVKARLPIKVLLADDSEIMREAIKKLLKDEPRIHIVGEASSFGAAMQLVADLKPDILLLDLHLPQKRELPRDKEVVAYCRGPYCVLSFEAVAALRAKGYDVRRLEEGFPEWKAAGLPVGPESDDRRPSVRSS